MRKGYFISFEGVDGSGQIDADRETAQGVSWTVGRIRGRSDQGAGRHGDR